MSTEKIAAGPFLDLSSSLPVIDVRSPSEFEAGHIPGALNIPIFSDRERELVGTKYKKEGQIPAILEGLRLTGPQMAAKLEQALKVSEGKKLLVHCWRGGMRSEAMAWLFSLGGIDTVVLEGGYKAYRSHILTSLSEKQKMFILGGLTGSSKTHIIRHLRTLGEQVIDLEGLANHKGSAFGALGEAPQPSTEHFANLLFKEWNSLSHDIPYWVEDESRNIGTVFLPELFYNNMQSAPTIVLMMSPQLRLPRLITEYSAFPPEALIASIMKISKRLGGDNTHEAVKAVETGDIGKAIEIVLVYYDKTYLYSIRRKGNGKIIFVETDTDDIETNTRKILAAARSFSL
jgi:tRNA 2-selenouridine synthase